MQVKRFLAGIFVAVLMVGLVNGVSAQQTPTTFTLQPGGKAVIDFEAFCIQFGEVFPNGIQGPSGLAPDAVRGALSYGVSKRLNANEQQALQLQYAIWQAIGAQGSPQGDATAQDVLANGKTPPANPQGRSLLDAFGTNQVKLTLTNWTPIGNKVAITPSATDNFYGRGQMTVENTSQQALTLYMPVGMQFASVDPAQQSMAGYATNVQVTNPQISSIHNTLPNTGGEEPSVLLLTAALSLLSLGLILHSMRRRFS